MIGRGRQYEDCPLPAPDVMFRGSAVGLRASAHLAPLGTLVVACGLAFPSEIGTDAIRDLGALPETLSFCLWGLSSCCTKCELREGFVTNTFRTSGA